MTQLIRINTHPTLKKKYASISPGTEAVTSTTKTGKTTESTLTNFSAEGLLFQAIGVVSGEVSFDEDYKRSTITICNKKYPLLYIAHKQGLKAFDELKAVLQNTQQQYQRLKVYPQVTHFKDPEKPHKIAFQLVNFDKGGQKQGALNDFNDLEFKLAGLWEFIPVSKLPCISVFKNVNVSRLKFVKRSKFTERVKFMEGTYVPLLWKDPIIEPFRFNPYAPKEEQEKSRFIALKAKFVPGEDIFAFDSLLSMPLDEPPTFFKVNKKMRAEAHERKKARQEHKDGKNKNSGQFNQPKKDDSSSTSESQS